MEVHFASTQHPRAARTLTAILLALAGFMLSPNSTAQAFVLKKTKGGQSVRWAEPSVTLRVDPKLEQVFGSDEIRAALAMSTDAWRGLPGVPSIEISEEAAPGYSLAERTNGVYLMDPWPFPKEQLAVTVSTYTTTGRMIGADILINPNTKYALLQESADERGVSQHDLGAVLTHEMGHVLGLDESPDDEMATMWPYIRAGEVHQRTIENDDEQGVIEAYAGTAPVEAAGCGQMSVAGSAQSERGGVALGLFAAALVFAGRRRSQAHKR
jgi:hypothetical protein